MSGTAGQELPHKVILIAAAIRKWEPFAVEAFLTVSSLWAGVRMWFGSREFIAQSAAQFLQPNLLTWKCIVAAAALTKLIGLGLCLSGSNRNLGLTLRCVGLALSGLFWTVLGWLLLVDAQATITSVPLILMGVSAWIALLRYPSLPKSAIS